MVLSNFIGVYLGFNENIMIIKGNAKLIVSIFLMMTSTKYSDKTIIKYFKNM